MKRQEGCGQVVHTCHRCVSRLPVASLAVTAVILIWLIPSANAIGAPSPDAQSSTLLGSTTPLVSEYGSRFGVSDQTAERHLSRQRLGAGLVDQLEAVQGPRYAGLWFDNRTGEFVVPELPSAPRASINSVLNRVGLGDAAVRTPSARYSWNELAAAQQRLDGQLKEAIQDNVVQTSLEPRTNSVLVLEATGIGRQAEAAVSRSVATADVAVETRKSQLPVFQARTDACSVGVRSCDPPIRGGAAIESSDETTGCTAGFNATGLLNGNRFILTAGHCYADSRFWRADNSHDEYEYLGEAEEGTFPGSDFAKIRISGNSYWAMGWTPQVVTWGTGFENVPITIESASFLGEFVCHSGATSGTSCGTVTALNTTVNYPQGTMYGLTEARGPSFCTEPGDSGGPVWSGHAAVGLLSGGEVAACGGHRGYYNEVTEADEAMGVSVGLRANMPPVVSGTGFSGVGPYQANGTATIDPNGLSTSVHADYGLTATYGRSSEDRAVGSGWQPRPASIQLAGLQPNATYHFRIVASNGAGVTYGPDQTFTTPGAVRIAVTASGASWDGILWAGSDGNIYRTDAPEGEWESHSPTWNRRGLPTGVKAVGGPAAIPTTSGWDGALWTGSDGNIYDTQARNGEWESWSPTWSHAGIPAGVKPVGNPVIAPSGSGWQGTLWIGSDGNIYWTHANGAGEWTSFSPTWSHVGIPTGVKPVGDPVPIKSGLDFAGILWTGSDGNIYDTQAPNGEWESWSLTWSHQGIPSGVEAVGSPAVWREGTGWAGAIWIGSDGNIYQTHAEGNGQWTSFSPTWSRKGIPTGVRPEGDPAVLPSANGSDGITWIGSDGNIYDTQARNGEWESWSPTWSHAGIPAGVKPIGDLAIAPAGSGWSGILWPGSDGNIYTTHAPEGEWETFSPTWSRKGIPPGVIPAP